MNPSQTSLAFSLNRYDRAVFDITPFLPTERLEQTIDRFYLFQDVDDLIFLFLVSSIKWLLFFHMTHNMTLSERQQQSIHNLQIIFLKIHYFCAKVRSPLKVIQLKFLSILFDYWRHKICLSNWYRSSVRNEVFHLVTSLKTLCSVFRKPTFFSFFHWFLNKYREQAFNLLISNVSTDTHWYSKNKSSDSSFSTTLGARG